MVDVFLLATGYLEDLKIYVRGQTINLGRKSYTSLSYNVLRKIKHSKERYQSIFGSCRSCSRLLEIWYRVICSNILQ